MKISCVSETVTVIELTEEEMKKYDFTFEESDYSSPHTRRVLWSIIDEASKITGLILTKLDGTAKGGIVISIRKELGMPVKFIGVGEKIDDMKPFNSSEFAKALFEQ